MSYELEQRPRRALGWMMGWMVGAASALPGTTLAQATPTASAFGGLSDVPPAPEEELAPVASYPTHYGARPLTLPRLTMRASARMGFLHIDFARFNPFVSLDVGAGIGVTDDLELGLGSPVMAPTLAAATLFTGQAGLGGWLRPETSRGVLPPSLYARYRLVATDSVELGVELDGMIPTRDFDGGIALGVPLRVRANDSFVLDASFGVLLGFGEGFSGGRRTDVIVSFSVLPRFTHQAFYVGLDTGLYFFADYPDEVIIPMVLELGATLGVGTSALDLYVRGGFPVLLATGDSSDLAYPETWLIGLGVRAHFGLGAP